MRFRAHVPAFVGMFIMAFSGCGPLGSSLNPGGLSSGSSNSSTNSRSIRGAGHCSVSGDIRRFEINCTSRIESLDVQGRRYGGGHGTGHVNWITAEHNIQIRYNGQNLNGSDSLGDTLEIDIYLEDSSMVTVSLGRD